MSIVSTSSVESSPSPAPRASLTREFSPWVSRASFLVAVVGVSFAFGAHWGRVDATAALSGPELPVAALPVVPSADQAEAMTPHLPAQAGSADVPSATF